MGVAKPDFLRCVGADQILIEKAERFARIDLDLSDFGKEHTHYVTVIVMTIIVMVFGYQLSFSDT